MPVPTGSCSHRQLTFDHAHEYLWLRQIVYRASNAVLSPPRFRLFVEDRGGSGATWLISPRMAAFAPGHALSPQRLHWFMERIRPQCQLRSKRVAGSALRIGEVQCQAPTAQFLHDQVARIQLREPEIGRECAGF